MQREQKNDIEQLLEHSRMVKGWMHGNSVKSTTVGNAGRQSLQCRWNAPSAYIFLAATKGEQEGILPLATTSLRRSEKKKSLLLLCFLWPSAI